jgi:Fe-S oxidoreductase
MANVALPFNNLHAQDGGFSSAGTYRAQNTRVQNSVKTLGGSPDAKIAGDVMDPMSFWSCNTCMACVEACPVGINHVDQIVGNRRHMTMMEGQLPHEAQATLRSLESRANPYGPPEDRTKWLDGLNVQQLQAGDAVDYLYWVGCVSAFDPRKQKIAKSLVTIMQRAGLSFGVLGSMEGCSGDPARRLGEENLFQTLAKKNIELLKSVSFKTLVANCPHCFNTIKNEYPQFGNLGEGRQPEIIHHSVLLRRLLEADKLPLKEEALKEVTFHDPCYLGRVNDEYEAPRKTLTAVKGLKILEMDRSREKGLCCGAGGGHFWMDLKIGERVNSVRADEAAKTGASTVATACPFCMQMMEDGVKLTNNEATLDVRDIAEVIAERLL